MSNPKAALQATAVQQQCKLLRLPAVGSQCAGLAELAVKEKQGHLDYREAFPAAEIEERERNTVARRLRDAPLPRMKTLAGSNEFSSNAICDGNRSLFILHNAKVIRPVMPLLLWILFAVGNIQSSHRFVAEQGFVSNAFALPHVVDGDAQIDSFVDQNELPAR
jgi:hypothetical protein